MIHQHIEQLQALLAAAANSSTENNNKNIGHYDIRRCLRMIQSLLMRGDDELQLLLLVGMSMEEEQEEQAQRQEQAQEQLTQDLIALIMTLEYECEDPSVTELVDALVPRAAGLLSSFPNVTLTKDQLQRLFPRVLYLIQQQQQQQQPVMIDSLLELLNQHLTASRLAQDVFEHQEEDHDHDGDAWIALQIVLTTTTEQSSSSSSSSKSLPLWVLTTSLLEYCQTHLIQHRNGTNANANANASWHAWVQRSLVSQHTYSSPELLRQHVDAFLKRLERFGMELLDTALQLLEQDEQQNPHSIVTVLQYTTLAIQFLVLILPTEDNNGTLFWNNTCTSNSSTSSSSFAGMSRSLWHALGAFCLLHLEDHDHAHHAHHDDHHHDDDDAITTRSTSIPEECQMAATDALWRLTTLHCSSSSSSSSSHEHPAQPDDPSSSSVILATIIRLLKQHDSAAESSSYYWNATNASTTYTWIRRALQHDPSIRHALQAALLSLAYLPNHTTTTSSASSSGHQHQHQFRPEQQLMSTLADWIWNNKEDENGSPTTTNGAGAGAGAGEEDPWQALVHEQLAEYSLELQQHQQQAN